MADEAGRSRLGRGLAALIGDVGEETAAVERAKSGSRRVPIEFIRANPKNPRRIFREEELADLSASIKEKGIIQPILVRGVPGKGDAYEIVAGERRWRAAQRAGVHDVPIILIEASDREALEIAIIENVQRADLNPLEEAMGYDSLISQFGYSHNDLARTIGKSRSHVANTMRLLKLPDSIKASLSDGRLTAGHARALLAHDDPDALAKEILDKGLSVRQAEAMSQARAEKAGKKTVTRARGAKDSDTAALEKRLTDMLGLRVTIEHRGEGGELRIRYRTLEQLDHVCRRLAG